MLLVAILTSLLVSPPIRITCILYLLFSENCPKLTHHQIIQTDPKISSISNIMFIYAECREKKTWFLKTKTKKHGIPTVTSPHPQGGTRNPEPAAVVLNVFVWQLQIWRYVAHRHAWLHSLSPQQRGETTERTGGGRTGGVLGEKGVYIYIYMYIYIYRHNKKVFKKWMYDSSVLLCFIEKSSSSNQW